MNALTVKWLGGERFLVGLDVGLGAVQCEFNAGELQKALAAACAEFQKWQIEPPSGLRPPKE